MNSPFQHLRERIAARRENESGYILAWTIGLIMVVVATSMLMLDNAQTGLRASKSSKNYMDQRTNLQDGWAAATQFINRDATQRTNRWINGSLGGDHGISIDDDTTFFYAIDPHSKTVGASGLKRLANGAFSWATEERPLRSYPVSAYATTDGITTYDMVAVSTKMSGTGRAFPLAGLWNNLLSFETSSTVIGFPVFHPHTIQSALGGRVERARGSVAGFGTGKMLMSPGFDGANTVYFNPFAQVVSADDGVSEYAVARNVSSSNLSARMDRVAFAKRFQGTGACTTMWESTAPATGYEQWYAKQTWAHMNENAASCHRGDLTLRGLNGTTRFAPTKATYLAVDGDLTIASDLSAKDSNSDLHIYVRGNVNFTKVGTQALDNVYIHASGSCTGRAASQLFFVGAMACRSMNLPGSVDFFRYRYPTLPDSNLPAPFGAGGVEMDHVNVIESPNFVDVHTLPSQ